MSDTLTMADFEKQVWQVRRSVILTEIPDRFAEEGFSGKTLAGASVWIEEHFSQIDTFASRALVNAADYGFPATWVSYSTQSTTVTN